MNLLLGQCHERACHQRLGDVGRTRCNLEVAAARPGVACCASAVRLLCVCLSASESHPATAPPRPTSCRGRLVLQESSHRGSTSRSSQQSDCPFCKKVNFVYTSSLPSFHESDFGNRLSESEVNTPPAGKHHHQQFLSFLPCQPHSDLPVLLSCDKRLDTIKDAEPFTGAVFRPPVQL